MSDSIERIENLIRVVSSIPDDSFDLGVWYNPTSQCGCALGHSTRDEYFIERKFCSPFVNVCTHIKDVAVFFEITHARAVALFWSRTGYQSRHDVLVALRVLLLEKMAQELPSQLESMNERELETVC